MHEQSAETKTNLVHADTLASTEAEVLGAFKGLVDASRALDLNRYLEYIDRDKSSFPM